MNKIAIYGVTALLLLSSVFALGIGAKNEQITAEGKKMIELFIINDEQKDMVVELGVIGGTVGVEVSPAEIKISREEQIKRIVVSLDFGKIKDYPIKIFASEKTEVSGQLSASANLVYKLPVIIPAAEQNSQKENKTESEVTTKFGEDDTKNQKDSQLVEKNDTGYKKEIATREFSGATIKADQKPKVEFELKQGDEKKVLFGGIIIIALVFLLNIFFIKRKNPLERYIIKSRKMGKTDEDIKNKLKEAGWSDMIVDAYLKK
jgi:hypothetical protein